MTGILDTPGSFRELTGSGFAIVYEKSAYIGSIFEGRGVMILEVDENSGTELMDCGINFAVLNN